MRPSGDLAVVSSERRKEILEQEQILGVPVQNLMTTEERNKAKRAKRFRKAADKEKTWRPSSTAISSLQDRSTAEESKLATSSCEEETLQS